MHFFPKPPYVEGTFFWFRAILPTALRPWLDSYRLYNFYSLAGGRRRAGRRMFCSCSCFVCFCSLLLLPSIIIEKSRFSHCHYYFAVSIGAEGRGCSGVAAGVRFLFEYGIYTIQLEGITITAQRSAATSLTNYALKRPWYLLAVALDDGCVRGNLVLNRRIRSVWRAFFL